MSESQEYVIDSLETNLFFARIMKEHALFLSAGFLTPNAEPAKEGVNFLRQFEMLLARTINLSNCVIRRCVLNSGEFVTEFTCCAEQQTQKLTGIAINQKLTAQTLQLQGRDCVANLCAPPALMQQVRRLNRDALALTERLIKYKERLLGGINSCCLFTANYPLLIEHILRETRLYRAHLLRLEGLNDADCQELRDSEIFWNEIMMEHALFIRGLLDPGEEKLICTANDFAADYKRLLETASAANDQTMCGPNTLTLTRKFRDFKQAGVAGIEACKIRSLILPLLADHVLREANHYIRLLESQAI